ncbi:hypothetical protein PIB30_046601 [Stylosanthes scabra]|uniref:Uncharacterized protein n=1 Tax=Stylosanthes scabra TaxID=79078 RepID=A0ABU6RGQ3_9FABA|nr:hypothetical protein [Stylosanthes scabra]
MLEISNGQTGGRYPKFLESLIDNKYLFKINVSEKNARGVDSMYNVTKISDDASLVDLYGSQLSLLDPGSVSNVANSSVVTVTDSEPTSEPITSLSKDSTLESICESGMATPSKGSLDSTVVSSSLEVLTNPEEKGPTTRHLGVVLNVKNKWFSCSIWDSLLVGENVVIW